MTLASNVVNCKEVDMSFLNYGKRAAYVSLAVLSVAWGAFPAVAQTQNRLIEYSAKFLCGVVQTNVPIGFAVRPGVYATSINIHNPQPPIGPAGGATTIFVKKAVVALPEGQQELPPSAFRRDELRADFAEEVDCNIIRKITGNSSPFIEGWVVLFVLPGPNGVTNELDVTGVYTVEAGQTDQRGDLDRAVSLELVPIPPRFIPLPAGAKFEGKIVEDK
jgi:hypothetical protein